MPVRKIPQNLNLLTTWTLPESNAAPIIPTPGSLPPSVAAPVEFPTNSEMPQPEMPRSESPASITPAVTFGAIVNSPPSRTGTPGPEDESKRKRISSQFPVFGTKDFPQYSATVVYNTDF